jgi:hypothetical protein
MIQCFFEGPIQIVLRSGGVVPTKDYGLDGLVFFELQYIETAALYVRRDGLSIVRPIPGTNVLGRGWKSNSLKAWEVWYNVVPPK